MKNNYCSPWRCWPALTALTLLAVSCATQPPATATYFSGSSVQVVKAAVPLQARPLPLSDVRLTGGPLKHAQELDAQYLLQLDPDRMLFYLRKSAGLDSKAAQGYGGWDGPGRNLTGHIAGHYLSAVSYMYAATGDFRFKQRADYLVAQLREIQDKQGDGYIGALEGTERVDGTNQLVAGKILFQQLSEGKIRSGGFDLNGMWSPWYVQHKLFAGLRDAYRLTGNPEALAVEIKFAGWVDGILSPLDQAQIQRMLSTEFGGMNEVMADLYADTGNQRWLKTYQDFEHHAVVDPLANHQDILAGKHGNTQIPKMIGELQYYRLTGNPSNGAAAEFFWDQVVAHHSYATGGHGHDEYFWPADKLNDFVAGRDDESCNVYNLLKLTRALFALHPDEKYAAFEERALFNHVLASIDPNDGRTCYMVPVGLGVRHEYQDMFEDFTCCVGTGMENHALHGAGIYFESGDKLWVNLFVPSIAHWKIENATLEMRTDFPAGESATLTLTLKSKTHFTLALRRPLWAGDGFAVSINGRKIYHLPSPGSYVELNRTWKNGDTVAVVLPKTLHQEPLPDNPQRVALMWGPLVLAGDLGPEEPRHASGNHADQSDAIPVFVAASQPLADWLKPVPGQSGNFRTEGVGRPTEVTFVPFYQLPERTYGIYWDLYTPQEWAKKAGQIAAERERQHQLELATVGFVQPGQMQSERDFNEQGEDSSPDRVMDRPARRGRNWFSFDLPVDASRPNSVVVTYYSDEWRKRTFDILVDGQEVGQQVIEKKGEPHFFDVEYAVPPSVTSGKQKVTIRFQATNGNEIGAVFGIRTIRGKAGN